jgi:hypothetical protein
LTLSGCSYDSISPQATRPCEEAYSRLLAEDPIFTVPLPGAEAVGSPQAGRCEDMDGGDVSYAVWERHSDSDAGSILDAFADAARNQAWQGVRLTKSGELPWLSDGPGVCAHRERDGHSQDLAMTVDEVTASGEARRVITVEITGDAGDYPAC